MRDVVEGGRSRSAAYHLGSAAYARSSMAIGDAAYKQLDDQGEREQIDALLMRTDGWSGNRCGLCEGVRFFLQLFWLRIISLLLG